MRRRLRFRWLSVGAALALVIAGGLQATRLGAEFLPILDEGDIVMHALRIPGTSLQQAVELQEQLEASIREMPEVERVFSKIGSGELATDPMPPSVAEQFHHAQTPSDVARSRKAEGRGCGRPGGTGDTHSG